MHPGRLVALLLVAVAWLTLAPTSVGGSTTYLITTGISMKPRMSTGDLVLVRDRSQYRVGDVVAYTSAQIGSVVLHRIVRAEDGRFVTQGDNNSWLDPDRPAPAEMIGAEWVHVRGGGKVLRAVGQPWVLGLVAFGIVAAGGTAAHQRKRKGRRRPVTPGNVPSASRRPQPSESLPPPLQTAAGVLAAVGVAGAALGGMSWTRPHDTLVSTPSSSATERMTFSYSATVPPSAAYDDTTVTAPEPVFRRLADTVEVSFRYAGSGVGRRTVSVAAELSASNGWRSSVPLTRPTEVAGAAHEGRVVLDFVALDDRVEAAAEATGMPVDDVGLAVVPTVTTASGEAFAPRLELELTPLQLRLAADDDAALTVEDALTLPGGMSREPATIALLGQELGVRTARIVSILLLLVGVVGGLEVRERARRAAARPEAERIRDRYGALLVDVSPVAPPPGRPVVDVPDFAALVRIAERYGLLVLHWTRSSTDTYVVQDEETVYRYRTAGAAADPGPVVEASDVLAAEEHDGTGSAPRAAAHDPRPDVDPDPPAPPHRTVLPGR